MAAEREIARQLFLVDETIEFEISTAEFPHPQAKQAILKNERTSIYTLQTHTHSTATLQRVWVRKYSNCTLQREQFEVFTAKADAARV